MGENMKVLNIGSLNFDYVYSVEHMVQEGETLSATKLETFFGGKGINQSIAIIQLDQKAKNCILLYGGANQCFTKDYLDQIFESFQEGDILLLQNEVNLLDCIIDQAYEKKMVIFLNPSPFQEQIRNCKLEKVSLFFINEIEGNQLTGETKPEKILDRLQEQYPNTKVVLTLGEKGSIYQFQKEYFEQEAFPVTPVDTTAAGDAFTGYFVAAILEQKSVQEALQLASKAASIAVSRKGAIDSIPYRGEV